MADDAVWVPNACTLPTVEQPLRVAEFDALFRRSLRSVRRVSPTLVRLTLSADDEQATRELTEREARCCSFFAFTITTSASTTSLDIAVRTERAEVLDRLVTRAADLIS